MESHPTDSGCSMAGRTAIRSDLHGPDDLRRLARVQHVPRVARRLLALANAMEGMSFSQAAHVVGSERQSLGDAIIRDNAEGLAGLYDQPKPGRPRKLIPMQEDEFGDVAAAGLVHHSDRGSQYCAGDYQKLVEDHGCVISMSGRGNCYDNAMVESVFKTIKSDLVWRTAFTSRWQASQAIGSSIEGFDNPRRRHSSLGYMSPANFEAAFRAGKKQETPALH